MKTKTKTKMSDVGRQQAPLDARALVALPVCYHGVNIAACICIPTIDWMPVNCESFAATAFVKTKAVALPDKQK